MKVLSRITKVSIVLVIVFFLAACTGQNTEKENVSTNDEQVEKKEVNNVKKEEKDNPETKNKKESSNNENDKQKKEEKKKPTQTAGTTERIPVTLTKTVDGDTIKVNYNDQEETIRYLLIDTPESKHPNSCVQPYGQDASDRNKQLVNSGNLEIEFDVGERKDKYGRLLAYVYVDGKSVQETLLKEGLARVAYIYPPNTRYLDQFEKAESSAKNNKVAIWKSNGYVTDNGFNGCEEQEQPKQQPQKTAPEPKPEPKQESPSVYYKNCSAARAAGAAPIHRGEPGYAKHLDRDGDGIGCDR